MKIDRNILALAALSFALAGCGSSTGAGAPPPTNPSQLNSNVLQFAVGTANLYGTSKGINFVVTYRQPSGGFHPGDSGALVSTPTLHVPFPIHAPMGSTVSYDGTSTAWYGPPGHERGKHDIESTSQAPNANSVTTFGQSGGAFGLGIEPFNLYGPADAPYPGLINTPFQVAPYPVPLYNIGGNNTNPNVLEPWGGPPAFDLLGNGQSPVGSSQVPSGQAGISEGLDVFKMPPVSGTYGITVLVATNVGNTSQSTSAHLNAGIGLPAATAPKTFVANGQGGGTMFADLPKGATEGYVQITDYGGSASSSSCNSAGGSSSTVIYYTILIHSSGTIRLPDKAGPGGADSICGGDKFTLQTIAFDYNMYEASYPASSGDPKPAIRGPRGQDDVSVSATACYVAPSGHGAAAACPAGTLPLPGQPQ